MPLVSDRDFWDSTAQAVYRLLTASASIDVLIRGGAGAVIESAVVGIRARHVEIGVAGPVVGFEKGEAEEVMALEKGAEKPERRGG